MNKNSTSKYFTIVIVLTALILNAIQVRADNPYSPVYLGPHLEVVTISTLPFKARYRFKVIETVDQDGNILYMPQFQIVSYGQNIGGGFSSNLRLTDKGETLYEGNKISLHKTLNADNRNKAEYRLDGLDKISLKRSKVGGRFVLDHKSNIQNLIPAANFKTEQFVRVCIEENEIIKEDPNSSPDYPYHGFVTLLDEEELIVDHENRPILIYKGCVDVLATKLNLAVITTREIQDNYPVPSNEYRVRGTIDYAPRDRVKDAVEVGSDGLQSNPIEGSDFTLPFSLALRESPLLINLPFELQVTLEGSENNTNLLKTDIEVDGQTGSFAKLHEGGGYVTHASSLKLKNSAPELAGLMKINDFGLNDFESLNFNINKNPSQIALFQPTHYGALFSTPKLMIFCFNQKTSAPAPIMMIYGIPNVDFRDMRFPFNSCTVFISKTLMFGYLRNPNLNREIESSAKLYFRDLPFTE